MNRPLALLILLLPACGDQPAPVPNTKTAGAAPAATSAETGDPLPPSIFVDATLTRSGKGGGPPVTVNVRDGEPVPWVVTDLIFQPLPFDSAAVVGTPHYVSHWETSESKPGSVKINSTLQGMPHDALFLEPVPGECEVLWADGSRGMLAGVWSNRYSDGDWHLVVVTSVPPENPDIKSVAIAVDLHRSTLVRRHVALIGVQQAAEFEFGVSDTRWFVAEDVSVHEFDVLRRNGEPILPLFDRGLRSNHLVRLTDASGTALHEMGGSIAGSMTHQDWGFITGHELVLPLRVTIDVPLETTTTRVVLRMKDIRPTR